MLPPVLFFIYCMSHLVQWKHCSECKGGGFFSKNHFKQNWRTKCSLVSPPPVKNFTTLVASEQSENFWLHSLVVIVKEHWLFLPSKLWTRICWSWEEQANQPRSDSCVNKACCAGWKLCHLHKVCLREEHKGRTWWKDEGREEVQSWTKPLEFFAQCSLRRIIQLHLNSMEHRGVACQEGISRKSPSDCVLLTGCLSVWFHLISATL